LILKNDGATVNKKNSGSRSSLRATKKARSSSVSTQVSGKKVAPNPRSVDKAKLPAHSEEISASGQRVAPLKSGEMQAATKNARVIKGKGVDQRAVVERVLVTPDSSGRTAQVKSARVVAAVPRMGLVKQSAHHAQGEADSAPLEAARPLLKVEKGGAAKDAGSRVVGRSVAQKIRDAQVARGARNSAASLQETASQDQCADNGSSRIKAVSSEGVKGVAVGGAAVALVGIEVKRPVSAAPKLALVAKAGASKPGPAKSTKGNAGATAGIPATKITRAEPSDPHRLGHGPGVNSVVHGAGKVAIQPLSSGRVLAASELIVGGQEPAFSDESGEEFRLGDKIVYPGHGVGEVEGVRATVLGGQEHRIYNIKIYHSGMKVMVPVAQSRAVGLRRIIDKRAIEQVYDILRVREVKIDLQTWNRRSREYAQKMKSGSPFEIAVVLRDLLILSIDKELSFSEKKMLDAAEALLVSEIAIARARPHESVAGELRALFA
jgi:CarD family transcriptional regulator